MDVRFLKWGNSIAVRIPAPVLRDLGVNEGQSADLSIVDGNLIVKPIAKRKRVPLEEYVSRISKENMHEEIFTGPPVGSEIW